jgi:1-acyl-sn-glycerol-3-phosphate acyltransferase
MPRGDFSLWHRTSFWASGTALTFLFSLRTEGMHHVPRSGPAILVSNHQSMMDSLLLGLAARRPLWHLARKTLFHPAWFAKLMYSLNAVPVDQEGLGIEGLRQMLRLLREGRAVTLFPEGERTHTGSMQKLMPGVSLLIKRSPAPIIPIGIAGAFEAWPRTRMLPTPAPLFLPAGRGTIAVSVGPRLDPARFANLDRDAILADLSAVIQGMRQRAEKLRRR